MDVSPMPWFVGVSAVIVGLVLVLTRMRARALSDLRDVLYGRGDTALYLRLLDNPRLRLLLSRRAIARLREEGVRFAADRDDGREAER